MSSDITWYYEVRHGGAWHCIELEPRICSKTLPEREYDALWAAVVWTSPAMIVRNYLLFAILADVRNYFEVRPIDRPRGLLVDVSAEVQAAWASEFYTLGTSWVALRELLDYDWDQQVQRSGEGPWMSCRSVAQEFVERTLPFLQQVVVDPGDLRIVFWFDN